MSDAAWHSLTPEQACERLETSPDGLSVQQVEARSAEYGANQLAEAPPDPAWRRFLRQFADITVIALLLAALLALGLALFETKDSSVLERFGDTIAIFLIVMLNAVIGFVQEGKAAAALTALKSLTAPTASVIRAGQRQQLNASELVPGDVVALQEGDRVPADLRLLGTNMLQVEEASLTGESVPVDKHTQPLPETAELAERNNQAFMATHVQRGSGTGVVIATGMNTEIGRIATMLGGVEVRRTPLQQQLDRFGKRVVLGCAVLAVFVFALSQLRSDASLGFSLLVAVSLAVAAIPEGLPAITTIVLALGVRRMANNNAILRRLAAVETLGSAHVICTDKTGTLTQNHMTVRRVWCAGQIHELEPEQQSPDAPGLATLLDAAAYTPAAQRSDDGTVTGDATDVALLELHDRTLGVDSERSPMQELPFDAERKLASVLLPSERGAAELIVHGAPEAVMERCSTWLSREATTPDGDHDREPSTEQPLDDGMRTQLSATVEQWGNEALRVIALARRRLSEDQLKQGKVSHDAEQELCLLGLMGLSDPPRPEVPAAIAKARQAGIQTLMITGDHPTTAAAIARELGLFADDPARHVLSGGELSKLSAQQLDERVEELGAVARATAADKLRIIESLQRRQRVVAMTGDGVNDAPAIKAADIGIAMGKGGTDVTREAADLVLADDNYASIVKAIEEGRSIYSNIQRFIVFLFAANAGLVLLVCAGSIAGWPAVLTPTQILWINLITNGLPALALGMEPKGGNPMTRPPRAPDRPLIGGRQLTEILLAGLWMGAMSSLAFFAANWAGPWLSLQGLPPHTALEGELVEPGHLRFARTMAFTVLALAPLFHAFNARSTKSAFSLGVFSNRTLTWAIGIGLALQLVAVYTPGVQDVFHTLPLSLPAFLVSVALGASVWPAGELLKLVKRTG